MAGWFDQNAPAGIQAPDAAAGGYQRAQADPKTAIMAILQRYPATPDGLQAAMPEIQRLYPGTRFDSSGGPADEFVIPGYGLVDVGDNFEGGDPSRMSWTWQHSGGGGAPGGAGAPGGSGYQPHSSEAYKFDVQEAMKAIQNSAAARGTLLTGGTLKALAGHASGLASREFDNDFNRFGTLASGGLGAAGTAASIYGDIGNAQAGGTIGSGNAWSNAITGIGDSVAGGLQLYGMTRPNYPNAADPRRQTPYPYAMNMTQPQPWRG